MLSMHVSYRPQSYLETLCLDGKQSKEHLTQHLADNFLSQSQVFELLRHGTLMLTKRKDHKLPLCPIPGIMYA